MGAALYLRIALFVEVFAVVYYGSSAFVGNMGSRTTSVGKTPHPKYEEEERPEPFGQRVLLPVLHRMETAIVRLAPSQVADQMKDRMDQADIRIPLGLVLLVRLGLFFMFSLIGIGLSSRLPIALLLIPGGWLASTLWIRQRIQRRTRIFAQDFPGAVDLLAAVADAGLSFDPAMAAVAETYPDPIGAEFRRVVANSRLGYSREEALNLLATRVPLKEVQDFVRGVVQGERQGVGISGTLRIQADNMNRVAYQAKKEKSGHMIVKMLFPMVLFMLPSTACVLLSLLAPSLLGSPL